MSRKSKASRFREDACSLNMLEYKEISKAKVCPTSSALEQRCTS